MGLTPWPDPAETSSRELRDHQAAQRDYMLRPPGATDTYIYGYKAGPCVPVRDPYHHSPRMSDAQRFLLAVCVWIVACCLAPIPGLAVAAVTGNPAALAVASVSGAVLFYLIVSTAGRIIYDR